MTSFRANSQADDGGRFFDPAATFNGHTAPRPLFKPVDRFCAEYEPLSYIIEPVVRTGSIYTLTAKTGAGKTGLGVIIGLANATGRSDILGMEVVHGRVAYCAFENPDDVRMRIMVAAFFLNIDLIKISDSFIILDARAKPEDLILELRAMSTTGNFSLVIIDTFAAAFDGKDVNDNVQAGEFVRRLRPITRLSGMPAMLITAHPTKSATDEQLVPYGGGAILNEVDGNLTLAKRSDTGNTVLHWQGKYRGLEFSPLHFRFDIGGAPDVIDSKGRLVQLPVLRPCDANAVEDRAKQEAEIERAILLCLAKDPVPTLREIGDLIGRKKSSIGAKLARMGREKLVEKVLDKWHLTAKGRSQI